jgi:hypothetical protein
VSRGRPRADRVADVFRVAAFLDEHPDASASFVASSLRIRKSEALRIVGGLRSLQSRFPKSERASE